MVARPVTLITGAASGIGHTTGDVFLQPGAGAPFVHEFPSIDRPGIDPPP